MARPRQGIAAVFSTKCRTVDQVFKSEEAFHAEFDLDQTSRLFARYRTERIRGTHDPNGPGLACRAVSLFVFLLAVG